MITIRYVGQNAVSVLAVLLLLLLSVDNIYFFLLLYSIYLLYISPPRAPTNVSFRFQFGYLIVRFKYRVATLYYNIVRFFILQFSNTFYRNNFEKITCR